jgi:putative spermidine/putrescine transport system permease protein
VTVGRVTGSLFAGIVAAFLLAPTAVMAAMSLSEGSILQFPPPGWTLDWYSRLAEDESWLDAARTSALVAAGTAVGATVLGTAVAVALARARFRGQSLIQAVVLSPLIVPLVVLAVGMFVTYSSWRLSGTYAGLLAAHIVLALPYVFIAVLTALQGVDPTLERAARTLGAGPLTAFREVTLPLIFPGIAIGALFAFIVSWDEVVVALFLTSPTVRTLPVLMWGQVRTEVEPTVAAVGTLLTAMSVLLLIAMAWLQHRGSKRIAGSVHG